MAKSAVNHNHLDSARTDFELGMILSWRAANAAPALEWCWVTPGEQSRVISRECRRGGDFSAISSKVYDPDSHALGADGKTITATLFPGNIVPQSRISPISKKLLEFYRTPQLPGAVNNYVTALARPQNREQFVLRTDYVESSKSAWAGRYSWGDEN